MPSDAVAPPSAARDGEIRRFLWTFLSISAVVLVLGFTGGAWLLRRVEGQLFVNQAHAAEREAAVIARLIDRDLAGGSTAGQTIEHLQSELKGSSSQTDFLCLLDEHGRVLSHPNPAMIGEQWGGMALRRLDNRQSLPISDVLASRQGAAGLQGGTGEPVQLVYYQPVSREPWTIAVHQNAAAIASEFATLRWNLAGTAVPILLLIAVTGAWLAQTISARHERELAAKNATLEQRVRERTAELRGALDQLRSAHERLLQGEKMHLLGELMAGIAHEINNPLASISMQSELLAMGAVRDALKTGTEIGQQTRRVSSIVRNLLNFARNRATERTATSLADVVRSAAELVTAELRRSDVELEIMVSPDLPRVMIDAQQIEQVLINLVRNAGQALVSQPGQRRIAVRAFTDGIWVVILVCDNGPGVPAAVRERIFESFITTKADGTGLGLSLCKRFIEAHGGVIELLADRGQTGARFRIQLPALGAKPAGASAAPGDGGVANHLRP